MTSPKTVYTNSPGAASRLGLPDIAFVGKAGSGKTTAADFLVRELGYTKLSFAAPIKAFEAEIFDGPPSRDRQIKLGRAIRTIDDGALVSRLLRLADDQWGPFVIDDVRYPSELIALSADGFVLVKVVASRAVRINRLKASRKLELLRHLDDESEVALAGCITDQTIDNSVGFVDEMYDRLLTIINQERRRR